MKFILAYGLILSLIVLLDGLLPKELYQAEVNHIVPAIETYPWLCSTEKTKTYAVLSNRRFYPMGPEKIGSFEEGDSVELSVSHILNNPSYLKNLRTGKGLVPSKGIFSYFFMLPIALAIISCLGIYYRNKPSILRNCCVLIIFFSLNTLFVLHNPLG